MFWGLVAAGHARVGDYEHLSIDDCDKANRAIEAVRAAERQASKRRTRR